MRFGLIVIALCLANLLFLVLVDLFAGGSNPYFGVLTYMVLPLFLVTAAAIESTCRLPQARGNSREFDSHSPLRQHSLCLGQVS